MPMSRSTQSAVVICVSAIVVGGLIWKSSKCRGVCKAAGRGLVYFGVNRILPVLFAEKA